MEALPIAQFTRRLVDVYEGRDCARSTIRQIAQVLREFSELERLDQATGAKVPLVLTTADLTDEAIAAWKKAFPARTPVTTRSHLRCLRSVCAWAVSRGFLEQTPFDRFRIRDWTRSDSRQAAPRRVWSISPDETRRVLALATLEAQKGSWEAGRREAFVYTLFLSGARPGEIRHLQVQDFRPGERTLTIQAKWVPKRGRDPVWWKPKSEGSAGELAIGDRLVRILRDWDFRRLRTRARREDRETCDWLFPGKDCQGPWGPGAPGFSPLDQMIALGARAGVPSLRCKSGRKGLGSHYGIGLTEMERMHYFRHEDEHTGEAYDEKRVDSMRGAADKIERFYLE
jgi:integrase